MSGRGTLMSESFVQPNVVPTQDDEAARAFAARFAARVEALDLKDAQIARRTGISTSAISRYRAGGWPKAINLFSLAEALQCSALWLITGTGELVAPSECSSSPDRASATKAATPPVATPTPVTEPAAPNAGSSTIERAFEAATTAARPTIERAVNEAVMVGALRHTQAMLGQLLAEEAATTPWARWKSASRGLVDWWAARFMSALYIAPKRKHPQKSSAFVPHNKTGNACPTCGTLV